MICEWSHTSDGAGGMVYPDGCRDVVVIRPVNARPKVTFSPFDHSPRWVSSASGTVFEGYRLPPGAQMSVDLGPYLADALKGSMDDIVLSHIYISTDIAEALEALAEQGVTVAQASRHLGLSLRRMERMMRRHGQPSPAVWQQLARARRSVVQIAHTTGNLAEIAADVGYSDQAHLTRAMRRWFGTTPGALRRDPALQSRLCQPGLGTAEQTSIK